jgi:hypothetical protein
MLWSEIGLVGSGRFLTKTHLRYLEVLQYRYNYPVVHTQGTQNSPLKDKAIDGVMTHSVNGNGRCDSDAMATTEMVMEGATATATATAAMVGATATVTAMEGTTAM